ncbi:hypothetical protein R1flu_023528 [Riccia fluitans]|uniref:Uncharacterized protein n=1 Tax=Riccia fluitans TaxID=41844 RepID=A0ABD1XVA0_9MARC
MQVRKSFVFFAGLELHGIKIDWSTVNVHKGINRYSAEEKEKAKKELWRMQVKFEGELCEPIDLETKKRRRTSGSRTSNKHSHESENTESRKRVEHTEAAASGPDGPDQVPVDQGQTHMPSGDAPANPSPVVDKGKAKVDERPKKPVEKNLDKQDAAQMRRARRENIEANRHGGRVLVGSEPVKVHGLGLTEAMAKMAWIVLARLGHQCKWRKLLVTSRVLLTKCSMTSKSPTKSVMDCKNGWKRPKKG